MRTPDEVQAMVRLRALGWGAKRIAAELGCSRSTVRRWLRKGGWRSLATPSRSKKLDGLTAWLGERFRRHAGNADVVRQELAAERGIVGSLRTVERAVAPLRKAAARTKRPALGDDRPAACHHPANRMRPLSTPLSLWLHVVGKCP